MEIIDKRILKDAIRAFGEINQKRMAIEECAELINALAKEPRNRATNEEIIEEIADVMIMCSQLALIYGEGMVENEIKKKQDRLNERITEYCGSREF